MEKTLSGHKNYLDASIKTAQYLAGLTVKQDIWSETGKVLVNFFDADIGAIGERRPDGEIAVHHWTFSKQFSGREYLDDDIREAIAEVLESGFLALRIISAPDPLSLAFLPITQESQVIAVMLAGHGMSEQFSKELLNVHLAVAGLVGTTASRLASEQELRGHRLHLEQLVQERTAELTKTNDQLQQEIIERGRVENELKQARTAAEAANRAKSAFLVNMSHELRTPLNAILGFTQLMNRDESIPESARKNLAIVNRSGEHLLAMINDVLDLSKIEAGKIELTEETFELVHAIEEVGEMIRSRAWVKGIDVAVVLDTCIERYIRTDLGKLRQVIINLLGNAVKFTERGNVTLRVRTAPVAGNLQRRFLEVEVEDTGPGIPKEKIDAIFDPFTQVGSIKASQKGTGLGLTISRSFISLLGGEITVKSEEGKGSIFRVRVQVDAVPAEEVPAAEVPPREVVGLEPGEPEWRVLVVEDDPENVVLLEVLLTQVGFSVRTASSDWEGIGVAEAWHPHFIWIAMRMPVIDGYETARRIRAYPWGKDIGIFVLTAHVYMEQEENLLAAGCDGVLFKPYRYGEIFEVMARHLGVRYRYSDKVAGGSPVLSDSGPPSEPAVEELAALQPEVAHRIRHAAVTLNKRDILAIADEIYEEHPAVSAFLKGQTASYRFEAIELLMELLDANQLP